MQIVYLDYNCFQRPFDNPLDTRIQIEALVCVEILRRTEAGEIELVWSFMHDDEARVCPFPERKAETIRLAELCKIRQGPTDTIRRDAAAFVTEQRLSPKDALHLAAAIAAGANCLLTCDDTFLLRARRANLGIALLNPVDYIRAQEK